ncbi:LysE family translocator [Fuerstiella marisgermanici]|uniref:Homoserine/homoserine lactone efflux protein n=1 Tax=Fuerstiella marisgermanici TaxID=1891926 RepID=A0A1P8WCN7_9PLAN|nr:LysE family translocator [Fuerstiella marisgermanici]APZ91799.1 Homoserine/homoserine lactone efflux protein [Fuerstiella marisgermanici]
MLPLDSMLTFLTASVLLSLAPGPDNIFVLTQSALNGKLAGLLVTLGLCTGLLVHTSAVAFGVAAIVQTSAVAFATLKFLGAGYLLFLAWQAFRGAGADLAKVGANKSGLGMLYRRGVIMNITNPKVSIFFLAFLPQFAVPANGPVIPQIMMLGGVFILVTLSVFGCVALAAGVLSDRFSKSDRVQRTLNRIAGVVFVCLALKLATTDR